MKEEVKENKAKVAKMEVAYKEGLKRDEELKKTKDTPNILLTEQR